MMQAPLVIERNPATKLTAVSAPSGSSLMVGQPAPATDRPALTGARP
ncbi:hypothetical protein [Paracoccus jeotgali]|nr:hypothetical protein [Paracoccus jeotgali]